MGGGLPVKTPEEQAQRVDQEAGRISRIVELASPYGCPVELYNHNNWFGQTDNEIAVIERLGQKNITGVGMVYNFSHGHWDIDDFAAKWKRMQPYVVAVNVSGMVKSEKLIPPSQGDYELPMLRVIQQSGWAGPIGLIAEQGGDAEVTLGNGLRGLAWLGKEVSTPGSGGERPKFAPAEGAVNSGAAKEVELVPGQFGKALDATSGGILVPGDDRWRKSPITVEAWVRLNSSKQFNVIVASDPKISGEHWELYSYRGAGDFSVFLPGKGGEIRSGVNICDHAWHHLAMVLGKDRVRLFVDAWLVKEAPITLATRPISPGYFGIGRTVETGIGCDGLIENVRISRGVREIIAVPTKALTRDESTIELWSFDVMPKNIVGDSRAAKPGPKPPLYVPERAPLQPENYPYWTAKVNRDRIYDFYAKEARDFAGVPEKPGAVPSYPGLDSGKYGHWGNQNEATWESDVWSHMDLGSMQCGILHQGGKSIKRAVCVNLGEASACFDPDTLTWPRAWHGGFIKFTSHRFGFIAGLQPGGPMDPAPEGQPAKPGSFVYHGYYRHGPRVIFSYQRDGKEWLESANVENGKVVVNRESADTGKLAAMVHGGPAQWPQKFETGVAAGTGKPYAIDNFTLPAKTPWNSPFHFGGLDFLPNGDAALCTFEGEVWIVSGIASNSGHVTWHKFASGLHQPLGLCVVDGKICVLGRDQITRLHDLNNDGEADFYECYCRAYEPSTGGHDFITGLRHDEDGHFFLVSTSMGLVRTSSDRTSITTLATGFRNPNGVGLGPKGEIAVAVQEGDWTPASMVYEITPQPGVPAGHYGFGGPKPGPRGHLPPLAYLPRGEDNSCGGQCYVEGDRWGVAAGTLIHFSWGTGRAFLILRQSFSGLSQGTVVPLPGEFRSGAHRGQFSPSDGQLYVAGMTGWGTYTPYEGSFERVRYVGGPAQLPRATEAHDNGLLIRFAEPLDKTTAEDPSRYFAQEWNYRYSAAYGSDEYSVRAPGLPGHDHLKITSAHVLPDGHSLFLEIPQLQPANNLHLHCNQPGFVARDLFFTLHQLDSPFTQFPGYHPIDKIPLDPVAAEQAMAALAQSTAPHPVEWEKGPPGRLLEIQTAAGMQFAQKELHAKAGERISLKFENGDAMPHNWVLVKPGTAEAVGGLADRLITEPDAMSRSYVPDSPDILCHTRILDPLKSMTIHFNAPAQPGRYPYMCTFPGHWVLMRGVLVVE
jgi:azurin